jgi:hypothetical protein
MRFKADIPRYVDTLFCSGLTRNHDQQRVGWVELFAKPITSESDLMGIASLHPSYELI